MEIIVLFIIGFIGSFLSGMIGIGGSIIKFPMLLYIPSLLGLTVYTVHEVSGISAVQVFFATFIAAWSFRKEGYLSKKIIITMGTSVLVGSFIGAYGSKLFDEEFVNFLYAILAALAAILILLPNKMNESFNSEWEKYFNTKLAMLLALIIGIVSGIVGAGGGFILVPVMLTVLKIPMKFTIANSLAITFVSSIGSTSGKIITGQIVMLPAIIMVIASVIAAPLGASLGKKMNNKVLHNILAILILLTAIKIWVDIVI